MSEPRRGPVVFSAEVQITGVNPYVLVNAERASALRSNWRRPMPVLLKINGSPDTPWRTNMMPDGRGSFYLYLHGGMRKSATTKVGDTVEIALSFDASYRNGPLHDSPDWFDAALKENATATKNWQQLSPSRQKEILRYFAGLKSEQAKRRNVMQAMRVLGGASDRFMGRDWLSGK